MGYWTSYEFSHIKEEKCLDKKLDGSPFSDIEAACQTVEQTLRHRNYGIHNAMEDNIFLVSISTDN